MPFPTSPPFSKNYLYTLHSLYFNLFFHNDFPQNERQQQQMNRSLFLQNTPSQFMIRYSQVDQRPSLKQQSVSVSSQYALQKHHKKKSLMNRSQVSSLEKNQRKVSAVQYSMRTNTDQRKEEREYSRVPIEYLDERDSGNPADRVRGRVLYRGYAPKNTYYYFKTIKQLKFNPTTKTEKDYRGEDIVFNSKFQSGNLNAAVRMGSREYWLYMREDTNTHGLRQWFFFEARSRKKGPFRFRIYKFSKRFSLYKSGMKPYIRTSESQWRQEGEKVVYQYDSQQKCFYLEFEYSFEEHKEVYFASLPPYTYSMMNDYLESLATDEKVAVKKIGLTLGGLDIYSIVISQKKGKKQYSKEETGKGETKQNFHRHPQSRQNVKKEAIVVTARTHPGETVSNWALENFISKVLDTPLLTQNYIFHIIPMVNPDGVFLGNHRTGVLGQDLNRNFHGCDFEYFPEIQAVQSYIAHINKKQKIAFMFDLHGHSAKRNIFAFGQECEIGSFRYLFGRIIPKILSNLIDSFKYDLCLFKASKEKANTARVYFSSKYGLNAVTFQQSYGLLDVGCLGIANWRNFGSALAESLEIYLRFNRDNLSKEISEYLQQLMKDEKDAIVKKKERKAERERVKELERQRERWLEKESEKQKEDVKSKTSFSKTEGAEKQSSSKFLIQFFNKIKSKGTNLENIQEEQISPKQSSSHSSHSSLSESSLSSGDEQLELKPAELQMIKKDIFKVGGGVNREAARRQLYSMAEKKVELSPHYVDMTTRLHHKQSQVVQRIFKFKSRQKQRESQFVPHSFSYRDKGSSIELPSIRK